MPLFEVDDNADKASFNATQNFALTYDPDTKDLSIVLPDRRHNGSTCTKDESFDNSSSNRITHLISKLGLLAKAQGQTSLIAAKDSKL